MFERPPTSIKVANAEEYIGVDGNIMRSLSTYLNFRLVYVETDYYKYGKILENGTAVGSLGDVVRQNTDVAGNGRFMIDYGTDAIEFTYPYQNDVMCFVVPKSSKIPRWTVLLRCFSLETWLALLGTFIFVILVLKTNRLAVFAIFITSPTDLRGFSKVQKLFLLFCIMYSVTINGIFQGSLTTSFSTVSYYPDIDTLDDLIESGLIITTNLDLLKHDDSPQAMALKEKQILSRGNWSFSRAAEKKDAAALERHLDAEFFIKERFLDEDGLPRLHVVKECVASYFLAFVVPKGSPFVEEFSFALRKLTEAGLTKKWYKDVVNNVILTTKVVALRQKGDHRAFALEDLQTAFYILVLGIIVSSCVFLWEMFRASS